MKTLGERLTYLRKQQRLTQRQLMDLLHFENLSKYENDQREPSFAILCQLAAYYQVSVDWLLTGQQSPYPEQTLSPDEKEWLTAYRQLSPENRLKIQGMMELKLSEQ